MKKIERIPYCMYLGKIIEEKGKHKEDIKERVKKGNVAAIISITIVNEKNFSNKRIDVGEKLLVCNNSHNSNRSRNMDKTNKNSRRVN